MKKKKNKLINHLKAGVLLLGISLLLWNCEKDFEYIEVETKQAEDIPLKTVHFALAQDFFKFEIKKEKKHLAKGSQTLELTPLWNSLSYQEIYKIEGAKLTSANVEINRKGNFESKLLFINSKGQIKNVVYTVYRDKTASNGTILDGTIYFNKINGEFIDGYKIKGGLFTKKMIVKKKDNLQQAGFLAFSFFQSSTEDSDCWNEENLPEDGMLENVDIGTVPAGGGGPSLSSLYSIIRSYNTDYSITNPGATGGGGSSVSGISARIFVETEDTEEDGSCSGIKVKNPSTQKCECPEGFVEDSNGVCVKKPCTGNPVKGGLEIAPQKGKSGSLGAMFGNSITSGCKRYGSNDCATPRNKKHDGIDIKSNYGDPIYAMNDGFIYSSKYHKKAGWNIRVQSTVNGKTILVSFFHLQKANRLLATNPLNFVKAGDIIGYQGDSGNLKNAITAGGVDSHVHIEVREHDGSNSWGYGHFNLVDPRDYFTTVIDNAGVSQTNTNCN